MQTKHRTSGFRHGLQGVIWWTLVSVSCISRLPKSNLKSPNWKEQFAQTFITSLQKLSSTLKSAFRHLANLANPINLATGRTTTHTHRHYQTQAQNTHIHAHTHKQTHTHTHTREHKPRSNRGKTTESCCRCLTKKRPL